MIGHTYPEQKQIKSKSQLLSQIAVNKKQIPIIEMI